MFEVEFDCFVTQKNWLYQGFHDPWSSPDLIGRPQSENSFLKCDFICLFQMNWNEKDQQKLFEFIGWFIEMFIFAKWNEAIEEFKMKRNENEKWNKNVFWMNPVLR